MKAKSLLVVIELLIVQSQITLYYHNVFASIQPTAKRGNISGVSTPSHLRSTCRERRRQSPDSDYPLRHSTSGWAHGSLLGESLFNVWLLHTIALNSDRVQTSKSGDLHTVSAVQKYKKSVQQTQVKLCATTDVAVFTPSHPLQNYMRS